MPHVIAVTGTSRGIGKEILQRLRDEGHIVYGSSRHPADDPMTLELDVTSDESTRQFVEKIISEQGRVDVLVNNAGFGAAGPIVETDMNLLHRQFDVNLYGPHRLIREVIPHMRSQGGGRIINIGSIADRLGLPYQGLYSASKAALALYTDTLRMELKGEGIDVCLIEPGDTRTDFDEGRIYPEGFVPEEHPEVMRSIEVMVKDEHNGADPKKIAKLVAKLVRKKKTKPRYTTGFDAWMVSRLLRILPFRVSEFLIMKYYKVKR